MSIYTRKGDDGTTGLLGGTRVKKSDSKINAIGNIDELNASIGLAISLLAPQKSQPTKLIFSWEDIVQQLQTIQTELMRLNANLANPTKSQSMPNKPPFPPTIIPNPPGQKEIDYLEHQIDNFDKELAKLTHFILPGGCSAGAALHLARTICRRAERSVTNSKYLNRLSDYLFTVARAVNHETLNEEIIWKNDN